MMLKNIKKINSIYEAQTFSIVNDCMVRVGDYIGIINGWPACASGKNDDSGFRKWFYRPDGDCWITTYLPLKNVWNIEREVKRGPCISSSKAIYSKYPGSVVVRMMLKHCQKTIN